MDLRFSIVFMLLLFNAASVCFANDDRSSSQKNFISFNTGNNNPIVQTVPLQTIPVDEDTFLYALDTSSENQPIVWSNPFLPQKNQHTVSLNPLSPQKQQTFSIPFSTNDYSFFRIEPNMGGSTVLSNSFLPQKNQPTVSLNPLSPQKQQTFSIPFSTNDNSFLRIEPNKGGSTVLSNPFLPQNNQPTFSLNPSSPQKQQTFSIPFSTNDNSFFRIEPNMGGSTVLSNSFLPQNNQPTFSLNPSSPQKQQTFSIPFSSNANSFSRVESNMGSSTGSKLPSNIQMFYPSVPDTSTQNTPSYYNTQFSTHYTTQSTTPTSPTPKFSEISPSISSESSLADAAPVKRGSQMTKSELKCEEYVREIAGTTEVASLVGTSSDVIKVTNVCEKANRLVTGGTEAGTGEFPHMVALGKYNSDGTFVLICGATLISHTWILTAAHCTYGPNGSPSFVRMGFNRLTDQQSGVTIEIQNMMRHPDYMPPAMYADIGLVQLVEPVRYNKVVRPACLYQEYDDVPVSAWISGWGVTEFAGDQSDSLQKAQLNLIDNIICTLRYNSSKEVPYGITPRMICAGDPNGGWKKDSCQGDSGGPLQVIHPQNLCLFQVIGITSFGQGCAVMDSPGVYTRISHYIPWIESIVWPEEK